MDTGLYPSVSMSEYRAWPAACQTILKIMRDKTPAHARQAMLFQEPETPAQALGTAVHMAVLQPDLFDDRYCVAPNIDRRTKAGREEWEAFIAEHADATILKQEDYDQCLAIRDAVRNHPIARKLLAGETEVSALWRDEGTGVLCKGRFDVVARKVGAIVDLKTTCDASRAAFARDVWRYAYYLQAGHYINGARVLGLEADYFAIIAVEKAPPYCVAVYYLTGETLQAGIDEIRLLLAQYAECERTGLWPGYPEAAEELDLPRWAWQAMDERWAE